MTIPKTTNMVINGILWSRFRSKNRPTKDIIVIPKVITLNFANVSFSVSSGLVKALELAEVKNAWMFSIDKGKNYIKNIIP